MLFCFSDMTDKKRKIAKSFRDTNYENELSKVVPAIREMGNGIVKREKMTKFFFVMIYL